MVYVCLVADWSQAKIGYTHSFGALGRHAVADWSQAKIGYTMLGCLVGSVRVADWSQAKIGYTRFKLVSNRSPVADWSQAKIGYTKIRKSRRLKVLRIGLRPRLVTLESGRSETRRCCGLVSGQDWLHCLEFALGRH